MAIKRPAPKQLSIEASEKIAQAGASWTGGSSRPKSYDPNFPVFEVPINQKVLVYIPNHTVTAEDGSIDIRADRFPAHPCMEGRSYLNVRCINGFVNDDAQLNWDGTCPLCSGLSEVWDLYNHQYREIAASRGMSVDAPEAQDALKNERIELLKNRVIKEPEEWITFPIVVIECTEKDGQKTAQPKLTSDGKLIGTPMWYSIRKRTFEEKWVAGYDSIEGEVPSSPAGLWAILNFTYTPKSGKCDKMGSAKALKVTFKTMDGYGEWASYFDKMTEEWTPAKAQEVLELDSIRSMEETQEVADALLKPVREKLALYSLGAAPQVAGIPQNSNAEQALAGFGATEAPQTPAAPSVPTGGITGEMPSAGV